MDLLVERGRRSRVDILRRVYQPEHARDRRCRSRRPGLECLESRQLLSTIVEIPIQMSFHNPDFIVTGSGGNLWFTETQNDNIGMIDPATRAISEFPIPG